MAEEGYCTLPSDDKVYWELVQDAFQPQISSLEVLITRINSYNPECKLGDSFDGLEAAISSEFFGSDYFFEELLPFIVSEAVKLKSVCPAPLPLLPQQLSDLPDSQVLMLERGGQVVSLLANMFLCTIQRPNWNDYPDVSFLHLFRNDYSHEVAKLQAFIHYFQRVMEERPVGFLYIRRMYHPAPSEEVWKASKCPLLPLKARTSGGIESDREAVHLDFANEYIGGGVLCGGCVQEEIRFAICPELCVSLLVCQVMGPADAIMLCGAEQFSAYSGYGFDLQFAGDHRDDSPRDLDLASSPRSCVLALDALRLRGRTACPPPHSQDECVEGKVAKVRAVAAGRQLRSGLLLREAGKALAGFVAPVTALLPEGGGGGASFLKPPPTDCGTTNGGGGGG